MYNTFAFYVARGHKLEDLEKMHPYEQVFYQMAMSKYYDDLFTTINTVAISYLGNEREKQEYLKKMEEEYNKFKR